MEHTETDESRQERRRKERRYAYLEGWAALALNMLLFGVKYWAGIVSGSLAIIADAWHTLSDSFTSLVVLAGTAVGGKPPDREHPFGHERAEVIAALVIGVLLAVLGFNFVVDGIEKLQAGTGAGFGIVAIMVTAGSLAAKEGLAQYAFWAGRKTGNSALRADGWHHRSDAISSLIILIGIFAGRSMWWVDGVMAILVAGLLLYAAWDVMWNAVGRLLGERPSDELVTVIERIASEVVGEEARSHHIHVHTYGSVREVSFHIKLPGDMPLRDSHAVATRIETRLRKEAEVEATVHVEPQEGGRGSPHHHT